MQAIHTLAAALVVASLSFVAVIAQAQTHATRDDATAMVRKGVAFVKANGKQKGYAEITSKQGQFRDRDLYLVVYGLDGTVHAHGANESGLVETVSDGQHVLIPIVVR